MRRTTSSCLVGMLAAAAVGVFAGSLPGAVVSASAATPPTITFAYTGAPQTYVVPADVCEVSVDAFGAQGGSGQTMSVAPGVDMPPVVPVPGGRGAAVTSRLTVVPGEMLQVNVGGRGGAGLGPRLDSVVGGWNGGGRGGDLHPIFGGGGGGASDVRQGGTSLTDRVVVAGGGGGTGAGSGSPYSDPQPAGGAGGAPGQPGGSGRVVVLEGFGVPTVTQIGDGPGGGGGGSAIAGGEPGGGQVGVGAPSGPDGEPGLLGRGGDAPQNTSQFLGVQTFAGGSEGGGGGGGLFGGGGGGATNGIGGIGAEVVWWLAGGGGGGGSSLGDDIENGVREGDGLVTIQPLAIPCPTPMTTTPRSISDVPPSAAGAQPTPSSPRPAATAPPAEAVVANPAYAG